MKVSERMKLVLHTRTFTVDNTLLMFHKTSRNKIWQEQKLDYGEFSYRQNLYFTANNTEYKRSMEISMTFPIHALILLLDCCQNNFSFRLLIELQNFLKVISWPAPPQFLQAPLTTKCMKFWF